MHSNLYTILFDIDGTLMVSGNAGRIAIESILEKEFAITEPALVPIHGQTDRGIAGSLFAEHGIENNHKNWSQFYESYLAELPATLERCEGNLLPGALEILHAIQQRSDAAIGLLTGNTRETAFHKLRHFQIDHFFEFGGFGDDHSCRNDVARDAISDATRHLGTAPDPSRTWVIGDTPNDIRCARAINANVVAVATGMYTTEQLNKSQPDICLADLSDWQGLIDRLLAG